MRGKGGQGGEGLTGKGRPQVRDIGSQEKRMERGEEDGARNGQGRREETERIIGEESSK